jgi:N-acetylmuramoyl-L-alanine amidase
MIDEGINNDLLVIQENENNQNSSIRDFFSLKSWKRWFGWDRSDNLEITPEFVVSYNELSSNDFNQVGLIDAVVGINTLNIIDWTDKTNNYNNRISSIVIHHTATNNAQQTLDAFESNGLSAHYIVDKDGSIYKLVDDEKRSWHAGVSDWENRSNLNDTSIGIEIINMGNQEFPEIQLSKVAELSKYLMNQYNIKPSNIIAHADIAPHRKFDPSGYFDWEKFYEEIGIFNGLYESKLSPDEKREVLLDWNSEELEDEIGKLQIDLKKFGYKIDNEGLYNYDTRDVVQAFNRHFSPEIFIKEQVEDEKVITNLENQKWYKISEERLEFLLRNI